MAKSLQEQLMSKGLVDNKKAKAIKQEQRKKNKQKPKGQTAVDANAERLAAEKAAKVERDKALNKAKQEEANAKAIVAQIKQLISTNKLSIEDDSIGYQFVDGTKIRKIFVSDKVQDQLSRGVLAIVKDGASYAVIPAVVAEKISQRDDSFIVSLNEKAGEVSDEEDPYADYKIPDDLMW